MASSGSALGNRKETAVQGAACPEHPFYSLKPLMELVIATTSIFQAPGIPATTEKALHAVSLIHTAIH